MNVLGRFVHLPTRRLVPLALLGLGQSAAAAAQVFLVARLVDGAPPLWAAPWVGVLALGLAIALDAALRRVELVRTEALGQDVVRDLRVDLFARALELEDTRLSDLRRGGIVLRFLGDLTPLRQWIALAFVRLPIALLTFVAGLSALAAMNVWMAAGVLVPLSLAALAGAWMARPLQRDLAKRRKHRNRLASNVANKIAALEAVRAAARETQELKRLRADCDRLRGAALAVAVRKQDLRVLVQAGLGLATLAVLVVGMGGAAGASSSAGQLVAALALLGTMAPALSAWSQLLEIRPELRLTRQRLESLYRLPLRPAHADADRFAPLLEVDLGSGEGPHRLEVADRSAPGTLVLLQGGSRTERSTWMAALAGLRTAPAGTVRLCGEDAIALSPATRRRLLGYARNDLALVRGSVSKNVRYRARGAQAADVLRALALCGWESADPELLDRRSNADGRDLEPELRAAVRLAQAVVDFPPLVLLDGLLDLLPGDKQQAFLEELRQRGTTVVVCDPDPCCAHLFDHTWNLSCVASRSSPFGSSWTALPPAAGASAAFLLVLFAAMPMVSARDAELEGSARQEKEGWDIHLGSRGLELNHRESELRFRLGGRIDLDAGLFSGDEPRPDPEAELRRARLSLSAKLGEDWRASASYGFGRSEGLRTLWLRWEGADPWHVTAGAQRTPFGMDEQTSSNQLVFMERSLASALSPGQLLGLAASWREGDVATSFGLFENNLENEPKRRSRGFGLVGRATAVPVRSDEHLIHVGVALELRDMDSDSRFRIRSRPETALGDVRLVDTGTLNGVSSSRTVGLELGWRAHSFVTQAEWIASQVDLPGENPTFWGAYAQVSTFLTDHRRRYDTRRGVFGTPRLDPVERALEIGARLSRLDLEDASVTGGISTDLTLGATWYWEPNVRILSDVVFAFADPDRGGEDRDLQVYQLRLQWSL